MMEDGRMVLTTYGYSTGLCIDPIEKKPLNHFLPGTPVMSFGTAGCNLGCRFCQNWHHSKSRSVARQSDRAAPEEIAAIAQRSGCRSVAFTYNDPVIFAEYAIDTAVACHALGLKTVAVTAGYITETARDEFYRHIDAANIDLKAFSEQFYKKLCFAELTPVLETLEWVKHETDTWFEVTTLLIPGHNDSDKELHELTEWFAETLGPDVPLHFSAFHPDFKLMNTPRTPQATLRRARAIAKSKGIRYVYTGNTHDLDGDATVCPGCGLRLIQRDWYNMLEYRMDGNHCPECGFEIAGVFENKPGDWGSKRAPVWIR